MQKSLSERLCGKYIIKGAVAFRCRKRFLRPDGVYRYSERAEKRLEKTIIELITDKN